MGTKKRLVTGCLDATEPVGRPAEEGTTDEPMTIVDSVGNDPAIITCHQAEEFVTQNVVGQ